MSQRPIQILAIEDQEFDAELLRRYLSRIPEFAITFLHYTEAEPALEALAQRDVDVILIDYLLGADTGLDVVQTIRNSGSICPIIVLTGHGNENIATELVRAGADDYIVKTDLNPDRLRQAIRTAQAQAARRAAERENERLVPELSKTRDQLEEKNRELTEFSETAHLFVDHVSHEFRTPLTVIQEFVSILRDGLAGDLNDEQREYLDIIRDRVDDLTVMVNDMLDVSRLESGVLGVCRTVCTVNEIIKRVRTSLERKAAANQIAIEIELRDDLPPVHCDPEKIGRVVINLVVNAIKFSHEGGRVRLWTRYERPEAQVVVGVTDEGPGIAPESLKAIFERFKQVGGSARSSTKGFGLGLNIARELVQLNFGDIRVASELGKGSTFSFTIPTADPSTLVPRFLKRLGAYRKGCTHVSLVTAEVDNAVSDAVLDEFRFFLVNQVRRTDLVLRPGRNRWLILAASNQPDLGPMIERIDGAWVETNRNRPGEPLPAPNLCVERTWRLGDNGKDLLDCVNAEFGGRVEVGA